MIVKLQFSQTSFVSSSSPYYRSASLNLTPLQFFHGCQFVYEEKYVIKYDLHPLKVVGYEGDTTLSVRLYGR